MDCSPPGSFVHVISQGRILELGWHFLLHGIFPTQGSNLCLLSLSLAGRFFVTSTTSWWELKRRVKRLVLNIQKMKIIAFSPVTLWQIEGEKVEAVTDYFLGLQNHCRQSLHLRRQRSLVCCSLWGHKESDPNWWLNNNNITGPSPVIAHSWFINEILV